MARAGSPWTTERARPLSTPTAAMTSIRLRRPKRKRSGCGAEAESAVRASGYGCGVVTPLLECCGGCAARMKSIEPERAGSRSINSSILQHDAHDAERTMEARVPPTGRVAHTDGA